MSIQPDEMKSQLQSTMARMLTTLERKVDPKHAALLVVNVQSDFGSYEGTEEDSTPIRDMMPRLISLIDRAREVDLPIVYIQSIYASDGNAYLSDVWLEQMGRASNGRQAERATHQKSSSGADFYAGIKPLPGEAVVSKRRYSAFADTDLDLMLRSKGIRTLIMTGVATNVSVETTARDGFMKDYYIVFLKDCTAASTKEAHDLSLANIAARFGEVAESEQVVKCWDRGCDAPWASDSPSVKS